jgi:hypothetical protein
MFAVSKMRVQGDDGYEGAGVSNSLLALPGARFELRAVCPEVSLLSAVVTPLVCVLGDDGWFLLTRRALSLPLLEATVMLVFEGDAAVRIFDDTVTDEFAAGGVMAARGRGRGGRWRRTVQWLWKTMVLLPGIDGGVAAGGGDGACKVTNHLIISL